MPIDNQIYNLYIGSIGVAVAIAVPIIIYYLQKKKKSLIFEEVQNISVIDINNDFKDKIEIKYANKLVNNLFVLTAKIKNNGSLSIKKSEIISPIKITYKEKFIECVVTEVNPPGVEVNLNISNYENSVECSFNLLNPLDYFTLQFVSLEKLSTPTIISRIDGLSKVNITSILDKGLLYSVRYDIDSYSDEHPFTHGPKILVQVLKHIESKQPLYYFSIPGLIITCIGFLMGLKFLQDYYTGGSLRFGPTLLMVMLTIVGVFMIFAGIMVHSISNSVYSLIKH